MARSFDQYLNRKRHEFGAKFDDSQLSKKFIPYYENERRIVVRTPWGEEARGTVGITTGWRPGFLLIHNSRSMGSSTILDDRFEIVGSATRSARTGRWMFT